MMAKKEILEGTKLGRIFDGEIKMRNKKAVELIVTPSDIEKLEKEGEIPIAFEKGTMNPIYLKLEK